MGLTDVQGLPLSGATKNAAKHYRRAVDVFNVFKGDPMGALDAAIQDAPNFVMAYLLRAHLLALTTQADTTLEARKILDHVRDRPMDDRERSHLAALDHLCAGNWTDAANALARHQMEWPHDIVALQSGHNMDFFRADARELRDRVARTLPLWSPDLPGYSVVLGMYAFGLEEMGDYGRAEAMGREAIARDARDSWAHHAVAHVFEMEGRAADGIAWMEDRSPHWASDDDFFKTHNWWHKALCYLEIDEPARALEVYDAHIRADGDPVVFGLLDGSALLWRLWASGVDVGQRWQSLARAWEPHLQGTGYPFNDWHGAMALLGAGQVAEVDAMILRLKSAGEGSEAAIWATTTGLALVQGFRAFATGDFEAAVSHLFPARQIAGRFGGSHAQRDVIDWTVTEAALRGKMPGAARCMAQERLALRPHSPVNRRFLKRAESLGAEYAPI